MKNHVVACLFLFSLDALSANISVQSSRIVFEEGMREKNFLIKNNDFTPVLIQSWISNIPDEMDPIKNSDTALMVSVPNLNLLPKQMKSIKIKPTFITINADKESLLWLNIYLVQANNPKGNVSQDTSQKLDLTYNIKLKVFYRPKVVAEAYRTFNPESSLCFSKTNDFLHIENKSAFYISLYKLELGNDVIDSQQINPRSNVKLTIKPGNFENTVTVNYIKDNGAIYEFKKDVRGYC